MPDSPTISQIKTIRYDGALETHSNIATTGGNIRLVGDSFSTPMFPVIKAPTGAITVIPTANLTVINSTTANLRIPALAAGYYHLALSDGDGRTAWKWNALFSTTPPTWVTAPTLATQVSATFFSVTLAATGAVSYSLADGSTLPNGVTFTSSSTGVVLSGIIIIPTNTTQTYAFTFNAISANGLVSPRQFSLSVTTATWRQRLLSTSNQFLEQLHFGSVAAPSRVWASFSGGSGSLATSIDNGNTWTRITAAATAAGQFSSMYGMCHGAGNMIVGLNNGRILRTSNYTTWNVLALFTPLPNKQNRLMAVRYAPRIGGNHFFIAAGDNAVVYTCVLSTANQWNNNPSISIMNQWGPDYSILDFASINNNTSNQVFILVGQSGRLARSVENQSGYYTPGTIGNNWSYIDIVAQGWPSNEDILTASTFFMGGVEYFFVGGSQGTFAISSNGSTWTIKTTQRLGENNQAIGQIADSSTLWSDNKVIIVAGNGKFSLSTNGGDTWSTSQYRNVNDTTSVSKGILSVPNNRILAGDSFIGVYSNN